MIRNIEPPPHNEMRHVTRKKRYRNQSKLQYHNTCTGKQHKMTDHIEKYIPSLRETNLKKSITGNNGFGKH